VSAHRGAKNLPVLQLIRTIAQLPDTLQVCEPFDAFINRSRIEARSGEKIAVKAPTLSVAGGLVLFYTLLIRASAPDPSILASDPQADPGTQALQCAGEPCDAVARGLRAFLDQNLEGLGANGRACADCHMPTDNFQLSPASVEARFRLLQLKRRGNPSADDPLFRPIDADDFRINGESASDFSNLRQNALVRITFELPPNIRLIDPDTNAPSDETFVDVWRSVPTVNDVALTGPDVANPWFRGPNEFGGYQLDGRFGTLQEQALGAFVTHAQTQNAPPQQLLDDLASFQRVLFTNHRVRVLADAVRNGAAPLPDPDQPLDEVEQQGKAVFERACAQCHGGASQSNPVLPVIRFHDISSQCPRPVDTATPARFVFAACTPQLARNERTYEITLPNNTVVRRTSSDPGRALLTGFVGGPAPRDDWNKLDTPGLRGIRKTAPYFHNNSAATLEEVVDHYIEFFKRVEANAVPGAPLPPVATTDGLRFDRRPTPEERAALLAYLRRL
jgi:cytochrome c peroxidase